MKRSVLDVEGCWGGEDIVEVSLAVGDEVKELSRTRRRRRRCELVDELVLCFTKAGDD